MAPKRPNGAGAFPQPVEHPVPKPPTSDALYAALDLGTNSCRMLIAQPKGSQFHVVDITLCGCAAKSCNATTWTGCDLSQPKPADARATPVISSHR